LAQSPAKEMLGMSHSQGNGGLGQSTINQALSPLVGLGHSNAPHVAIAKILDQTSLRITPRLCRVRLNVSPFSNVLVNKTCDCDCLSQLSLWHQAGIGQFAVQVIPQASHPCS
jgi:hypothetical protein